MIDHQRLLRPRAKRRGFAYATVLLITVGASAAVYEAQKVHEEAGAISRNNEQVRLQQAAAGQEPNQKEREFQRHWTALRQERAFPWANVFRAVEHVADPDIELLEFRPDRRAGTLVLKGEGRSSESVMRYLERLQEDSTFSRVYLAHTAGMERGQLLTRSFELRLNLNGNLLEPR